MSPCRCVTCRFASNYSKPLLNQTRWSVKRENLEQRRRAIITLLAPASFSRSVEFFTPRHSDEQLSNKYLILLDFLLKLKGESLSETRATYIEKERDVDWWVVMWWDHDQQSHLLHHYPIWFLLILFSSTMNKVDRLCFSL